MWPLLLVVRPARLVLLVPTAVMALSTAVALTRFTVPTSRASAVPSLRRYRLSVATPPSVRAASLAALSSSIRLASVPMVFLASRSTLPVVSISAAPSVAAVVLSAPPAMTLTVPVVLTSLPLSTPAPVVPVLSVVPPSVSRTMWPLVPPTAVRRSM